MNFYNEIHSPTTSDFERLRPSAVRHLPHSVECGSRWQTYGSSSGWSSAVYACAVGEQFERKHFYLDIPTHDKNLLEVGLSNRENREFVEAFSQTTNDSLHLDISSHHFSRTRVFRVSDLTQCLIPTICISIAQLGNSPDNQFYPMRDTCGCSSHTTLDKAILGALKESLERQFLLRYWLTKICKKKISIRHARELLTHSPSLALFNLLAKTGDVALLDITDHRFPGTCLLFCYGYGGSNSSNVRYCAGMAYASTPQISLEKSVCELWQTYRHMNSLSPDDPAPADPYLKHFLSCNTYDTFKEMSTPTDYYSSATPVSRNCRFNIQTLTTAIKNLSLNGYLYISSTPTTNKHIYFCKYLSPNMFLHMNNAQHFNIANRFSKSFFSDIKHSQTLTMVPFP